MKELVDAMRAAVEGGNWYAGLFIALALPDICGRIDDPGQKSVGARYAKWFDTHVGGRYTSERDGRVILSGIECYGLRCALLHEGSGELDPKHSARLKRVRFVFTPPNVYVHMNTSLDTLELRVDIFCHDIGSAVLRWAGGERDPAKLCAIQARLSIEPLGFDGVVSL